MRSRPFKLLLLALAVGGAVKAWQQLQQPAPAPSSPRTAGGAPSGSTAVRPADAASHGSDEPAAAGGSDEGSTLAPASPYVDPLAPEGPSEEEPAEALDPLPDPPRGPFTTAPDGPADDLQRISGIGPKLESMLNEQGITTFAQLASLDEDGVDALQARLPQFPGRVRRDDWIGQARQLSSS